MTRLLRFASFLFLGSLLAPLGAWAQLNSAGAVDRATLMGIVFSEPQNKWVYQAKVELCDGGGNKITDTYTTESGQFAFSDIPRTNYILKISADGYQSQEIPVDLSFGSDRNFSITLKPAASGAKTVPLGSPSATISVHEMSMPEKARNLVLSGEKKLYQDKDPQGALGDFQQAVSAAPDYFEAYYQIAMTDEALGKKDDAEQSFRKSIEVSGDKYGEAQVGLGALLAQEGKAEEGEKAIRRGIELNPEFWGGSFELGKILLSQGKFEDASKEAEHAKALSPNTPVIYRLLANIHLAEKDYYSFVQDLDAYIKLDPASPAGVRAKALRDQYAQKAEAQGPPKSNPK